MWKQLAAALIITFAFSPGIAEDDIAQVEYLTPLEQEVVRELNLARTNPKAYAGFINEWLPYYDGKLRKLPDRTAVRTKEGTRAVKDAIRFLKKTDPVEPLYPSLGMSLGARDHVADLGPVGGTGHEGRDGSRSASRVNRYGRWRGFTAEAICYGSDSARETVMRLVIDDGVRNRGHRINVFEPVFFYVGVSIGPHRVYDTMCVITFAADYVE